MDYSAEVPGLVFGPYRCSEAHSRLSNGVVPTEIVLPQMFGIFTNYRLTGTNSRWDALNQDSLLVRVSFFFIGG